MAAGRISGSNSPRHARFQERVRFAGYLRPGRVTLLALALLAVLAAAGVGLHHAHAQASQQPGRQPASRPDSQSDTSADTSSDAKSGSDANSDLNDPPPVLPTDPPGWKPDTAAADAPAAPAPKAASVPSSTAAPAPATPARAPKPADAVAAAPAKPAAMPLPTDPRQRQVAIVSSDLLQMATDLKAAVDKSTKDELSIAVVRKAGEIEQYARKVRDGTRLTAGKE